MINSKATQDNVTSQANKAILAQSNREKLTNGIIANHSEPLTIQDLLRSVDAEGNALCYDIDSREFVTLTPFEQFQKYKKTTGSKPNPEKQSFDIFAHDTMTPYRFHAGMNMGMVYKAGKLAKDGWEAVANSLSFNLYEALFKQALKDGNGVTQVMATLDDKGWKTDNIRGYQSLYCEFDSIPIEEQGKVIADLEAAGLKVTVVYSAGKSLHIHIRFDSLVVDRDYFLWLESLFIPLHGDPDILTKARQLMRAAGFYRKEKKKFQNLVQFTKESYSTQQIETAIKAVYQKRGLKWVSYQDYQSAKQKRDYSGYTATDLSKIPNDVLRRLWPELTKALPTYLGHTDTRSTYSHKTTEGNSIGVMPLAAALANLYGTETAISLLESQYPGQRNWRNFCWDKKKSQYGLRTIKQSIEFLSGEHFDFPEYFNNSLPKRSFTLKEVISKLKESLKGRAKGFGHIQKIGEEITGNRQHAWVNAIANGHDLLDASLPGSGKSHDVPTIENSNGKTWYVYGDHRNPTIKEIEDDFTDLFPRNKYGYYRDDQDKLKTATKDTPKHLIEIKGNCGRADLFPALVNLGYDPNNGGSDNPICGTCPFRKQCVAVEGSYLHDRREVLGESKKIRCHIESMPREWDYRHDVIIIDEPSQLLTATKVISGNWNDLINDVERYRDVLNRDQRIELDDWIHELKQLTKTSPRYGYEHSELVEKLPVLSDDLKLAIANNPINIEPLFIEAEAEVSIGDNAEAFEGMTAQEIKQLKRKLHRHNKAQRSEQFSATSRNLEQLPPNLISAIFDGGIMRLNSYGIAVTVNRSDTYDFLNKSKSNIWLDATISPERLVMMAGIKRQLKVIRTVEHDDLSNLTIKQITLDGIGSKDITDLGVERVTKVMDYLNNQHQTQIPLIALKSWQPQINNQHYWFRDSRGVNDFAGLPYIAAAGSPCPNLGVIKDEYLALNGHLDGWESHYARLVNEEILQCIGRPRANRYPGQKFTFYYLTPKGLDLSWLSNFGVSVEKIPVYSLVPDCATPFERSKAEIWGSVKELISKGVKATQIAISEALNMTQGSVSKVLSKWGMSIADLQHLIESEYKKEYSDSYIDSNRKGNTNHAVQTSEQEIIDCWGWVFQLDPVVLLQESIIHIERGGFDALRDALRDYPSIIKAKFWAVLGTALDMEIMESQLP